MQPLSYVAVSVKSFITTMFQDPPILVPDSGARSAHGINEALFGDHLHVFTNEIPLQYLTDSHVDIVLGFAEDQVAKLGKRFDVAVLQEAVLACCEDHSLPSPECLDELRQKLSRPTERRDMAYAVPRISLRSVKFIGARDLPDIDRILDAMIILPPDAKHFFRSLGYMYFPNERVLEHSDAPHSVPAYYRRLNRSAA